MRMIIIAVIALLVLGGGGAGVYFFFLQPAEASQGTEEAAADGDHKSGNAKKEKEAKAKGGHGGAVEYVELDPLILPIVDNNGLNQTVSLVIALEVSSPEAKAAVETMTPKLKDAYIQDMYGTLSKPSTLKDGMIQVGELKQRLNKISTDVLGEDVITDVLLQVVQQRPI